MSKEEPIIIGGNDQQRESQQALEFAKKDANHLMENSPIIPKLLSVEIITRRLFMLIRNGMQSEVMEAWDLNNPQLVLHTLSQAAADYSLKHGVRPTDLRKEVLEIVLPVIDIFCQMEKEADEQSKEGPVVLRDDHESPGGVGEILRGSDSSEELEGSGEDRETDQGQTS